MIDFEIPYEIRILQASVHQFIEKDLIPLEKEIECRGFITNEESGTVRKKSRELGFMAMGFPTELNGGGLDTVALCLINEEIGRVSDILSRRAFGAIPVSLLQGTEQQKEKYLLPAIAGDTHISTAISEPGSGSDVSAIQTRVRRDSNGWILNGCKHFISDADFADAFIVTAKNEQGAIDCFIIDKSTPGLTLGRKQAMMGIRGVQHYEVYFDDCHLPDDALLGIPGRGLATVLHAKNRDRLVGVGARSIGLAQHILSMSIEYAQSRIQFSQAIAQFQLIQEKLSRMQIRIYAARSMMLHCAWSVDQGRDCRAFVSAVKIFASETLAQVTDNAIQIFGGAGYTTDWPLERYYRDARISRIYEGTTEIHLLSIARSLLKNGAFQI